MDKTVFSFEDTPDSRLDTLLSTVMLEWAKVNGNEFARLMAYYKCAMMEIETKFKVPKKGTETSVVSCELITGKTHQIRAHIAYYGHPIVGDNKYGKSSEKQLHLTANFLCFNFKKDNKLNYLKNKTFEIIPTWL